MEGLVMDEYLVSWSEEMSSEQFKLLVEWPGSYVVVACRIVVSAPFPVSFLFLFGPWTWDFGFGT